MERYRLKNIIILILVLLNAFLLVSLGIRGTKEHTARRAQQQELVALFAADGMTLDPALIPSDTELSAYTLIREESLEKRVAAFWLGSISERTAQGGGIYTYSTARGAAIFRDIGSFDAAGTLSQGSAEDFCRDFCEEFSYSEPVFTLDDTGSGTVMTVSGSLLPDTAVETASDTEPLTAVAALIAFQQMRHESSSVVSAITEISLCYELQNTAAASMTLVPSWQIVTDTAIFYVNCISGTVRRA